MDGETPSIVSPIVEWGNENKDNLSFKTTNRKEKSMDVTKLTAIIGVILALSIASERLVEIIKGFIPSLDKEALDPKAEGRRRSYLQILAVFSGVLTAFLARDYMPTEIAKPTESWSIFGLGLLASGGSSFWNSVLAYVTKVKDIKKVEAETAKKTLS